MVVGRHFIESGPGALGIHGYVFEAGHTIGSARQNFFDERRIEVGLESGRLFGIVPGEQESAAFGTEVEAGSTCR